jgi:poly-gamma-glutamate synthesis protein (capsule biosynthesis protein)
MNGKSATSRLSDGGSAVRLVFVGDICLAGGLQADLARRGPEYPFASVRDALADADLVVGNLECCIVDEPGMAEPPVNRMVVPERLAACVAHSRIDMMSLANNHILDGGERGILSTQRFLDRHGIRHFGAGLTRDQAERPLYFERNALRFAFLGACDVPGVYATGASGGVPAMDARRLGRRVRDCRTKADVVIVCLHADLEFTRYPSPSRVRLSRWLVEQGADLVVQHHPHVCQGIERHGEGLIAYSLGNFVFRVAGNEYFHDKAGTDWGLVLNVDVGAAPSRPRLSYEARPVTIDARNETRLSTGERRARQLSALAEMSRGLGDWRVLRRERVSRCVEEARATLYRLYYLGHRRGLAAVLADLGDVFKNPYERRWLYSLLSWGLLG